MAVDFPLDGPLAQQASAVPYRNSERGLEFCLITASGNPRKWGFPKGAIDPGETPPEAALKEAWEEAGLRGEISEAPLGQYLYKKSGRRLRVVVYLMEVQVCALYWDESHRRKRQWVRAEQVPAKLGSSLLQPLFELAIAQLEQNDGLPSLDSLLNDSGNEARLAD